MLLFGGAALACGNEVYLSKKTQEAAVAKAEAQLAAGDAASAVRGLMRAAHYPPMARRFEFAFSRRPLRLRAWRVAAIAVVRTPGHQPFDHGLPDAAPVQPPRQLTWARGVLARELAARPDDPVVVALDAEARGAAGTDALEDLARRDLMPDAWAWRALAAGRAHRGDAAGRDAALTRCRAVATPGVTCDDAPTLL
ncbi:MAG: hypothetical protein H6706_20695 [Myxococcales bacterium]|nr:hypothetical protein [Myxococcales bacterium]